MSSGVYIMVLTKVVKREGAIKNLDRQFRVYVAVRKNGELQVSEATMKGKPKKTVFLKGKLRKERFKGKFYERGQTVKVTGKLVSPNTLQGNIAHPRINPELGFLEMRINLSKSKNE